MNSIFSAVIQAVVQGLTEFLPVSSSGHLSLIQHFTGTDPESNHIMTVVLHLGTLVAVFIAFRTDIRDMIREFFLTIRDIAASKYSWKKMNPSRRMMFMVIISTLMLVPVLPFKSFFEAPSGDNDIIFEGAAFLVTSVLLFLSDAAVKGAKEAGDMKIRDALVVGAFQIFALFPGVSRSGSTITSSVFCGLTRKTAVTYSFILGIPAILGGGAIELHDALKQDMVLNIPALLIGFVISAVVGLLAIKLVRVLIKKERFKIFGVYTMLLGAACIIWGIFETVTGTRLFLEWK